MKISYPRIRAIISRSQWTAIGLCILAIAASQTPYVQAMIGRATGAGAAHTAGHPLLQPVGTTNGLVAWYKMDGDVKDSSGKGYDGTANSFSYDGTTNGYVQGKFGQGLLMNGSSTYVSVPSNSDFNSYPLTLSAWVKTTTTTGTTLGIVSKYLDSSSNGYSLFMTGGHACAYYYSSSSNKVTASTCNGASQGIEIGNVADGNWHHIAFVVSASGGTGYLDGKSISTTAWAGSATATTTSENLWMGNYDYSSGEYFPGTIDDARVYNRNLSAAEVTTLFQGSNPSQCDQSCVSWWKFDDNTGTSATDPISSQTGTLTGSPSWTSGKFGSAVSFNNIASNTQYISYGTNNSAFKFAKGNFTITAWVNPSSSYTAGGSTSIFGVNAATSTSRYDLGLNSPTCNGAAGQVNRLMLFIKDDSANNYTVCSTTALNLDQWNHMAMVVNRNGQVMYGYINGVLVLTQSLSTLTDNVSPQGTGYTSNVVNGAGSWLTGAVDDIRLYNRALSDSEIYDQYMAGISGN